MENEPHKHAADCIFVKNSSCAACDLRHTHKNYSHPISRSVVQQVKNNDVDVIQTRAHSTNHHLNSLREIRRLLTLCVPVSMFVGQHFLQKRRTHFSKQIQMDGTSFLVVSHTITVKPTISSSSVCALKTSANI